MLKKLVGYSAYMFGANSVTALLTFAVTALGMVSRSKEAFGDYALYMLVYSVCSSLLSSGVNSTIQKFAADDDVNRVRFAKLAYIGFALMLVLFPACGAIVWFVLEMQVVALGFFGAPWVIVYFWGRFILRSTLDARREARLLVVASLSNSVFQFLFLRFTDLRDALIYGDALALLASGLVALVSLPNGVGRSFSEILRVELPKSFLKEAFQFSIPVWWAGLVFDGKGYLERFVTRKTLGAAALGAYQAAITMWQFAIKPIEYLGQASLPGLVAAREERDIVYRDLVRFCFITFSLVAISVACGIPFIFQVIDFIASLRGSTGAPLVEKYQEVPHLLMIMSLGVPAVLVEMVTSRYAIALGRQKLVLWAEITNLAVIAILLYPLTRAYGIYGVLISSVIGQYCNASCFLYFLWSSKRDSMKTSLRWLILSAFLLAASLVPSILLGSHWFSWLGAVPGVLIFSGGAYLGGMLRKDDFGRAFAVIRRRSGKG